MSKIAQKSGAVRAETKSAKKGPGKGIRAKGSSVGKPKTGKSMLRRFGKA